MKNLKNLSQDTKELLLLFVLPILVTALLVIIFPAAF